MSYIAFAWIATIVFGIETVIIKLSGKYSIKNPWLFNILWNWCYVLFMFPFFLRTGVGVPHQWGNLLIASFLSAVCCALYIVLIYRIDVSVLSPMYNVRTCFSVLFGFLFLGEIFTPYKLALIVVIIIMGLLVSFDEKFSFKAFLSKNILLVLLFMILLSLYGIFLNKAIAETGYWTATIWTGFLPALFLIFTYPMFKNDLKNVKAKQLIPVFLVGLTSLISTLASNKAYAVNVGITTVIFSIPTSMIFAFVMSIFWPKLMEKHSLKIYAIRFAAAAIMLVCALQLS